MRLVLAFMAGALFLVGLLGALLFVFSGEWEKAALWGLLAGASLVAVAASWLMDADV